MSIRKHRINVLSISNFVEPRCIDGFKLCEPIDTSGFYEVARPEWRFQQPGESRKEYLKRYQREYHKRQWYPDHQRERIQETKERRAALLEWYTSYKTTMNSLEKGSRQCGFPLDEP